MNTVLRKFWLVASTLALAGLVAAGAQAGSVPQGYSAQQWTAIQLRSEALNQKYHLGAYRTVSGESAQAERALVLRSDALNRKYHLGRYAVSTATPTQAGGFDWGDAGVGSAVTLGVILAALGVTAGARRFRTVRRAVA